MKLPYVLCQVLVELGLENGALIGRQVIHNRNIRAAGWAQLRAKTKPPPSAHPSLCLGCEARGCSQHRALAPPWQPAAGLPELLGHPRGRGRLCQPRRSPSTAAT